MQTGRSTVRDGLENKIESYLLTHFKWLWDFVQSNEGLQHEVNKILINKAIYKVPTRPYPLSTMADYTSWDSLTDRTFSSRHLPPSDRDPATLPPLDDLKPLFLRRNDTGLLSDKSTVLFPYFAQWFTDGFLRTNRQNNLKNTSNHDIDLSPLYGLNKGITDALRSYQGGKLDHQFINGEEYPPYYFEDAEHGIVKDKFKSITMVYPGYVYPDGTTHPGHIDPDKKAKLFAMGKETSNVQIGYVMMNTLFLREHNRICDRLAERYPTWDDERLFQTARNILIVLLIKVVIQEYINHISPYYFKFLADPKPFRNERWYRQNWMAVEFNLLYRWHSLVPSLVSLDGQELPMYQTMWNNDMVIQHGLGRLFEAASLQPAGQIGLLNTPSFLIDVDLKSVQLGRDARLKSYNDYRELCEFPRVTDFDQITGNPEAQDLLRQIYGNVDNIEFYVGLFAEDVRENSALPSLIGRLVGVDAFSQALTNPLLNEHIFNADTFTPLGMEIIESTRNLSEILHRNIPQPDRPFTVTMTQVGYTPS
jgi:prostaglandin-endoperoxide synthase 2